MFNFIMTKSTFTKHFGGGRKGRNLFFILPTGKFRLEDVKRKKCSRTCPEAASDTGTEARVLVFCL